MDSYVLHEERGGGPAGDYMTRTVGQKLIEEKIRTAAEVATRFAATGIVEEKREEEFTVRYDEQKNGIKTSILNMVEGAFTDIVEKDRLDNILVLNVDKLAKLTRSWTP